MKVEELRKLDDKSSRSHKLRTVFNLKNDQKAENVKAFLDELMAVYPYPIRMIPTNNGKESTNCFCRGRKQPSGKYIFGHLCQRLVIGY
ncbi:MAG: hypothetical protein ACP5UA_04675 [Candidatus Hydrogenedens sp.]